MQKLQSKVGQLSRSVKSTLMQSEIETLMSSELEKFRESMMSHISTNGDHLINM